MDDEITRDTNAVTAEHSFMAVEREVIDVFANQQMGEKSGCGQASYERASRCGGNNGRKVALDFVTVFYADNAAFKKLGGCEVKKLGGFLADSLKGVWVGGDEIGNDFSGFDGEFLQAGDARAVGFAFYRWLPFFSDEYGLLRCVCAGGGFELFRHLLEEQLELGGINLLAFCTKKAANQVVELGFEKDDFGI